MHKHDKGRLKSFARAFRCYEESVHTCACGTTYRDRFDENESGDEFSEESEEETAVDHRIVILKFENKQYADCCKCWHERAIRIMDQLECYGAEIMKFFQAERQRKEQELRDSIDPSHKYDMEPAPPGLVETLDSKSIRVIDPSDLAPS